MFRETRFCNLYIFEDVHPRGCFNPFVWFELLVLELVSGGSFLPGSVELLPYQVVVHVCDIQCDFSNGREDVLWEGHVVRNDDVVEPSVYAEVFSCDPVYESLRCWVACLCSDGS